MIDWSRVAELREEIGAEGLAEVVELFLEEVDEAVNQLRDSTTPDTLEQRLHFLKGSALSLGFSSFSDLCEAGEMAARTGQANDVDLTAIISEYDKSRVLFLAQLPGQIAA